jgi:hypothetical protein
MIGLPGSFFSFFAQPDEKNGSATQVKVVFQMSLTTGEGNEGFGG